MKPVVVITMGDPAGIGPEITARTLSSKKVRRLCRPVVIGDETFLKPFGWKQAPGEMIAVSGSRPGSVRYGYPQKRAGRIALDAVRIGVDRCRSGRADALVTAPVDKHACALSAPGFTGHTGMLARL